MELLFVLHKDSLRLEANGSKDHSHTANIFYFRIEYFTSKTDFDQIRK